mmetsp:Transcript_6505/g.19755  ORF Transcript_6505/g.19755 Transcript_6505/m.19755 type:complete len:81 (+) Transcript_6505:1560-1802(+)
MEDGRWEMGDGSAKQCQLTCSWPRGFRTPQEEDGHPVAATGRVMLPELTFILLGGAISDLLCCLLFSFLGGGRGGRGERV